MKSMGDKRKGARLPSKPMRRQCFIACSSIAAFLLVLAAISAFAGIRAPGKYSGVVVFDRWDGCILFGGVYLMHISESVKEALRAYDGYAIEIDALEVIQPMNPGDGRIMKYKVLGPAKDSQKRAVLDGVVLRVESPFTSQGPPSAIIEIRNEGDKAVPVDSSQLGVALLMKKVWNSEFYLFDPSDGPSTAVITRAGLTNPNYKREESVNDLKRSYSYVMDANDALPRSFDLEPGGSRRTTITFQVSPGEYEFMIGYGGGTQEEKNLASNRFSFDVDDRGVATVVDITEH